MKKFIVILAAVVVLAVLGWVWYSTRLAQYIDIERGFVIGYPREFTLGNDSFNNFSFDNPEDGVNGLKLTRYLRSTRCTERGSEVHQCWPLTENPSISFYVVGKSLDETIRGGMDTVGDLFADITLAGKNGKYVEMGAEGEGMFVYYIPMSENRTMIITRTYIDENNLISYKDVDGFESLEEQKEIFDKIISTLKIL